jgi:hypothetical protein
VGRAPFPHLVALLCGFLAAAAIGCGADRSNLIPGDDASSLKNQLAEIKSQIDAGECDGLADKVKAFHDDATSLDPSVDKRLRTRLRQGANSLEEHALQDCQAAKAQTQTQTTDTTTETTPAETVPTDTTTTTAPPETTTTPPAETTTTPPADTTTTPPADTTTIPPPSEDNGGTPGEDQLP